MRRALATTSPHAEPPLAVVATYRVLFADCDPMRVVYYANYLRLFEIGRAELFRGLGYPFRAYVAQGVYLAVVGVRCHYRRPAHYDDELAIRAGIAELGRARMTVAYAIDRGDERIADGATEHCVVDDAGRPQRLPTAFRAALRAAGLLPAAP